MATPEDPAVAPTDMISSFFWPTGSPEGMSYEQLKQRRAVAAALASRARPYPKTFGEGLSSLGESVANAMYQKTTDAVEREKAALGREFGKPLEAAEPAPVAGPAGSAAVAPELISAPASLTAELPPEIDTGRSAVAQAAMRRPGSIQLAALNTGTMSDAGQPGLTYGGPQAAGPGASIAERPDTEPPASIADGRNSLVPTMLAQAGAGRPPAAAAPGAGGVSPPAGGTVAPPTTAIPRPPEARPGGSYPAPGEIRATPPTKPGDIPPRPVTGQATPAMIEIQRRLNDPRFQQIDPVLRERAKQQLEQLKAARDKQDAITIENWQKKRDDVLAAQKKFEEDTQSYPKRQQELQDLTAKNVRIQRFGSENLANEAEKTTAESWKQVSPSVNALRQLPRIKETVDQMFAGAGANVKLQGAKILDMMDKLVGRPGWFQDEIQATETFKSMMAGQVAAVIKSTVGSAGISNADREFAERAAGGDISLDAASIRRIVDITRRMALNNIKTHNEALASTFDDPTGWDRATHKRFGIELPQEAFDTEDLMHLRATPNSPEERKRFDEIYGKGSARKVLGFGR